MMTRKQAKVAFRKNINESEVAPFVKMVILSNPIRVCVRPPAAPINQKWSTWNELCAAVRKAAATGTRVVHKGTKGRVKSFSLVTGWRLEVVREDYEEVWEW